MPSVLHPIVGGIMIAAVLSVVPAALAVAPAAQAAPDCTDIGPNTRMCTRAPGHTAITTSPDPAFTNGWPGWGFGGLGYGFGIGGVWIGI